MLSVGYFLGQTIPNIDKYLHYVIAIVIFLSILPGIIAWLRAKMKAERTKNFATSS